MTATVECIIEPWVEKALRLLRSDEEDSTEQLRLMLEESLKQKYGHKKSLKRISGTLLSKDEPAAKKKKVEIKRNSDSDVSSLDSNDVNELIEDVFSCKVCRGLSSTPSNQLVDCSGCHNHYHQECYSPPIPDSDVNDPRVVWYCSSCSKTVAKPKQPSQISGSSSQSNNGSSSKSSLPSKSSSVRSNVQSSFGGKPFGGTSNSFSTRKASGSSSSTSGTTSSSSSGSSSKASSSSSSKNIPKINIIHADKRLQIMKKKAAKKHEKRGLGSSK